jgi:hypothetical protein
MLIDAPPISTHTLFVNSFSMGGTTTVQIDVSGGDPIPTSTTPVEFYTCMFEILPAAPLNGQFLSNMNGQAQNEAMMPFPNVTGSDGIIDVMPAPTDTPTETPTPTPTPTNTPTPTDTPTATPTNTPAPATFLRVFVTSTDTHTGDLGSISGGDMVCQSLASGLGVAGTWIAWLSDSTIDARDRLLDTQYRLVDETTIIANDLPDLIDGMIQNPINMTESMLPVMGTVVVWTGTSPDGTLNPVNGSCDEWMSAFPVDFGALGQHNLTDFQWTDVDQDSCDGTAHLYCFERPLRAFVTSTMEGTDFGGIAAGDAICQARADAAPLGGTWVALLSDSMTDAANRIRDAEYRLVDNATVIATSAPDLFDGNIDAPINLDESGMLQMGGVSTGSEPSGLRTPLNCGEWTSTTGNLTAGNASQVGTGWINNGSELCSAAGNYRLYCFEIDSRPCGQQNQRCCANNACAVGLMCALGTAGTCM